MWPHLSLSLSLSLSLTHTHTMTTRRNWKRTRQIEAEEDFTSLSVS
jgi:hypothetical protein